MTRYSRYERQAGNDPAGMPNNYRQNIFIWDLTQKRAARGSGTFAHGKYDVHWAGGLFFVYD